MTKTNTIECNQVLWVVGALERLATLGMLTTPPHVVSSGAIDLFIDLDDARYALFPDNQVIEEIVGALVYDCNRSVDVDLIEGNTWGDTFWGQVDGKGENKLGKLLMKIRDELMEGK